MGAQRQNLCVGFCPTQRTYKTPVQGFGFIKTFAVANISMTNVCPSIIAIPFDLIIGGGEKTKFGKTWSLQTTITIECPSNTMQHGGQSWTRSQNTSTTGLCNCIDHFVGNMRCNFIKSTNCSESIYHWKYLWVTKLGKYKVAKNVRSGMFTLTSDCIGSSTAKLLVKVVAGGHKLCTI